MSLFHYVTYKLVVIRDKRLGVVYYAITALILLYTLIEIFVMKGYLEFDESPKGTMRILVSDHRDDPDVTQTNLSHLPPYCCNKDDMEKKSNKVRKFCGSCEAVDVQELSWPVESQMLSLMSFCKDRWQVKHKNSSLQQQNYVNIRERKYYTLDPEDVKIKIEHSIIATRFSRKSDDAIAASQRTLTGFLYDTQGNVIKRMSSNGDKKHQRGQADKLTVQELLHAAGVTSLDDISDAVNAKGKSYRRHGIVLHVVIGYYNAEKTWLGTGPIEYSYHVHRIPYADYRINQIIPVISKDVFSTIPNNPDTNNSGEDDGLQDTMETRLYRKRYGIKIEFYQSGRLGRFSFPSFLLKLVAGVGLLTLTATIVDLAALYFLPDRFQYRQYVYEESPLILKKRKEEKGKTE
ncbi:P2X receptor E-like [Actinia tenebrosa]|uniref:P2X receptor E-like n=1 Tax=Actinia tenebrosa TaxID=6105 RepID=A0A6P8J128_ACTTE|nr:P2X receptor E-like [Actinia tenebrosa]